ncbi:MULTISPECIES: fimbrial protein [Pantoea]|uniref:Major fimbrial subunit LpfA n=1 Tax=Pantoea ananas TaxID=553 RepID=A0AAJ1FQG7_PANAN|nr:fimbrial protein [Pantoea ananatis]MBN6030574.1 fimbrial protein [Pantoea ananatis]MCK0552054.1 fimbrial protein [Pantoea ananatis]MCW0343079.1 putative major fimbrial subunit LpfA [Pantoea ananatis]MCW0352073.1 putative major fimbrial subunit LpfA [Pantoea ananatis]MDC7861935.1 fimbrial protein [Pantoea ananatis]
MKKTLIAIALMATSAISSSAFASDGAVNFTGTITDAACTIDTASQNQDVFLGNIARTAFSGAGSLAAAKKFTLVLTDCPDTVTGATVRFDGTQVSGDNSILALTAGDSTATGVGVQISDSQNKVVPLFEDSSVYPLVSTGPNNLDFSARYISVADDVTVGDANAVTQFTVVYQ